jgi:hypothetical protein
MKTMGRRRIFVVGTGMAITPAGIQQAAATPPARAPGERMPGMVVGHNIVTGRELGKKLCEVLGLDPNVVAKVSIECDASEIAKVYVERAIYEEQAKEVVTVLEEYALNGPKLEEIL